MTEAKKSIGSATLAVVMGAALTLSACGNEKGTNTPMNGDTTPPSMPTPTPGQALLAGHVRDVSGTAVAGATVKVTETGGTTTTDADGAYSLAVPSNSSVTLLVTATNFAKSYRESVMLADAAQVSGFDLFVIAPAEVTAQNAAAVGDKADTRGLMAIRLHSMGSGCALAGAHVAVWPPLAATVMYSRPTTVTGGMDLPDAAMDGVQDGATVHAWLVGAVPPANMLQLSVEQPGCSLMDQSPSFEGLMFPGERWVEAQALTEADLFLSEVQ